MKQKGPFQDLPRCAHLQQLPGMPSPPFVPSAKGFPGKPKSWAEVVGCNCSLFTASAFIISCALF